MRVRLPSPALAIAVAALFIALSGTAVAAAIVPLAKRALSADNAKKLGGRTAAQIVSSAAVQPGPASSAVGLVAIRTAPVNVAPDGVAPATVACAAGEKVTGGGFTGGGGAPLLLTSGATADGSGWSVLVLNLSESAGASGTVQAVCVK